MHWDSFVTDISLAVVPVDGQTRSGKEVFDVAPQDHVHRARMATLLGGERRLGHSDLSRAATSYFSEATKLLLNHGAAVYTPFEGDTRLGRRVILRAAVPAGAKRNTSLPTLDIRLSKNRAEQVARARQALRAMRLPPLPVQGADGLPTHWIDIEGWTEAQNALVLEGTRDLGGHVGGRLTDSITHYYYAVRLLRTAAFLQELRQVIAQRLNGWLAFTGALETAVALTISGLPTREEVEAAQSALAAGKGPFSEILAPFMGR